MPTVSSELLAIPRKQKTRDSYDIKPEGQIQQMDVLSMKPDKGYNYLLVVVDQSRKMDMKPMKGKSAEDVIIALKHIWSNKGHKILKVPMVLESDPGTEFNNKTIKDYLEKKDVEQRIGKPGRHSQIALVENKNLTIGRRIGSINTAESLITGQGASDWVSYVPGIVKELNELGKGRRTKLIKEKKEEDDRVDLNGQVKVNEASVLNIGDKVRVKLEKVKDVVSGRTIPGANKFRATDIRWSPYIHKVTNVKIPEPGRNKPLRYQIDDEDGKQDDSVSYLRDELQPIGKQDYGDYKTITKKKSLPKTFIAQHVLGEKMLNNKLYYIVKYRGFPNASYELASEFVKNDHNKSLL